MEALFQSPFTPASQPSSGCGTVTVVSEDDPGDDPPDDPGDDPLPEVDLQILAGGAALVVLILLLLLLR